MIFAGIFISAVFVFPLSFPVQIFCVIFAYFPLFCLSHQRCQDFGAPGVVGILVMPLILFQPPLFFLAMVLMGAIKGTEGANRYGEAGGLGRVPSARAAPPGEAGGGSNSRLFLIVVGILAVLGLVVGVALYQEEGDRLQTMQTMAVPEVVLVQPVGLEDETGIEGDVDAESPSKDVPYVSPYEEKARRRRAARLAARLAAEAEEGDVDAEPPSKYVPYVSPYEKAKAAEEAAATPAEPEEPEAGSVSVNVRGTWGQLEIDGKPFGTTPYTGSLSAGLHTIRVYNVAAGIDRERIVRIEAGESTRVTFSAP
jgi:hypothetical protein